MTATILTDDYTPRTVGDTANPLQVQLLDYKKVPYDISALASSDFSLQLCEQSTQAVIDGAGSFSVVDGLNGIVQYTWDATDVAIAGIYNIVVKAMFAGKPLHFRGKVLEIRLIN
jgi:hypothetical protein